MKTTLALPPQPLAMHPDEEIDLRQALASAEQITRVDQASMKEQNHYLLFAKMLLRELDATRLALAAAR